MKISDLVRQRAREAGASLHANANVARFIRCEEIGQLEDEVAQAMGGVLRALAIDTEADHNTKDTARRVARMFVREVFAGRFEEPPALTDFPNVAGLDEIVVAGPITIRSACSHHMVPIMGEAWVGFIPGERVIGLSKFTRVAEWIMARPQIQEEATVQLADALWEAMKPKALGVVVKARHFCCGWRGVRDAGQEMTTSVMRGWFREHPEARAEFLSLLKGRGA